MIDAIHLPLGALALALCLMLTSNQAPAQQAAQQDNPYNVPDPLMLPDGSQATTAEAWREVGRPHTLALFEEHVYGKAPGKPANLTFEVFDNAADALDGKATRRQIAIYLTGDKAGPRMDLLLYIPNKTAGPAPAFLTLNFKGNHSISDDPAIRITPSWVRRDDKRGVVNHRATEKARGVAKDRWPIEMIIDRGYALATIYYGDIDPDYDDGFKNGVHAHFGAKGKKPAPDQWGSIAAWAWGLSRGLDVLEAVKEIDAKRVAVMGHSRLGKTALWAGATDQRFAMVVSNNSGCGGAALSRRRSGETVKRINTVFPHWFCDNFLKYNGNEDALPVDQHMLIALAAPRPVYIASAEKDAWADPQGEFLSAKYASPVYQLLTGKGFAADAMPALDKPVTSLIGYHIRTGGHDVKDFDWRQYLDHADRYMAR